MSGFPWRTLVVLSLLAWLPLIAVGVVLVVE